VYGLQTFRLAFNIYLFFLRKTIHLFVAVPTIERHCIEGPCLWSVFASLHHSQSLMNLGRGVEVPAGDRLEINDAKLT
jgi:hypothetical protein